MENQVINASGPIDIDFLIGILQKCKDSGEKCIGIMLFDCEFGYQPQNIDAEFHIVSEVDFFNKE